MYLENMIYGIALEALYCDSRHAWLSSFRDEPELWLMPRRRWFRAFRQAVEELAGGDGADATLLIVWDSDPESRSPLPN